MTASEWQACPRLSSYPAALPPLALLAGRVHSGPLTLARKNAPSATRRPKRALRARPPPYALAMRSGSHPWYRDPMLLKDLPFAFRTLRRSPVFTIAAALTIALGIGASTAIFSVVNAVLLRPLPYREPDRLAVMYMDLRARNSLAMPLSNENYVDIRDGSKGSFEDMAAFRTGRQVIPGKDGTPEQVRLAVVTTNFFRMMGAGIALGRDFTEERWPAAAAAARATGGRRARRAGSAAAAGRRDHQLRVLAATLRRRCQRARPADSGRPASGDRRRAGAAGSNCSSRPGPTWSSGPTSGSPTVSTTTTPTGTRSDSGRSDV